MVHATTRLEPRAIALEATSNPANAEVLGALWDLVDAILRSRQSAASASPAQAALIRLAKLGPLRVSDLAADLRQDQSTTSRHLTNLIEQGLVERTDDPSDRRAHLMDVTDAGMLAAHSAIAARVAMLEQVMDAWPDADRLEFARLLGAFTASLTALKTEGARA